MFVRLKNGEELCEARLVRLTGRAIPVRLNPFRVLELLTNVFIFISKLISGHETSAIARAWDFPIPL